MAKSEDESSFNVSKSVDVINIHFPLRYFRDFIFIDTPGLGSSESATDGSVRDNFQGKSHVLWLMDASDRTLLNSLSLLNKEKKILKNNLDKICFIGNKFDLINLEEEESHSTLREELLKALNDGLFKILDGENVNPDLILTSFKKPNKKFGETTTFGEIKKIEDKFQIDKKETNIDNIEDFVSCLKDVLKQLKDNIIADKKAEISKKIKEASIKKNHCKLR